MASENLAYYTNLYLQSLDTAYQIERQIQRLQRDIEELSLMAKREYDVADDAIDSAKADGYTKDDWELIE
jgi:prefoldin subunit 5